MAFEENVFVNCPYDEDFYPLLRPILFTVIYAGLNPRLALEELDSGEARIQKILRIIGESKYAIHDLSRIQAEKAGDYFRLNMPFELGLDVGCRFFSTDRRGAKRCLVLEAERFRYQAALSDLSNSDIAVHGNIPMKAIVAVRNWLHSETEAHVPGPTRIRDAFMDFMASNYDALIARGFSDDEIEDLPLGELTEYMRDWVGKNA